MILTRLFISVLLFLPSCNIKMTDEYDIVLIDDSSIKYYHWEEVLNHRKTLRLENPNPDLSVVPTIVIDQSKKYYFVPDPFNGFIHIYDLFRRHDL